MEPRKLLDTLAVADRLKDTTRHCYTAGGRHESVAEHSWRAALMAYFLRDEFPEADMDKVIRMLLIHDLGEAFTGDIPSFRKTAANEADEDTLLKEWVATLPQPYAGEMQALYDEMEADLQKKGDGSNHQIDLLSDKRNTYIRVNRAAKTALEVFDDILHKEKLERNDLELLIDQILVYEDHLEIKLQADIDSLLRCGTLEECVKGISAANFDSDTENSENTLIQSSKNHEDKVFRVNVISDGDPLEIYTEKDGGVIFRKYSPMGDLQEFAAQMCESIGSATGHIAAVTDRDSIIALYGIPKRELMDKPNSPELEKLMEQRKNYLYKNGDAPILAADGEEKYHLGAAAPILSQGDLMGCVLLLLGENDSPLQEADQGLVKTAAGFLGKQMEN